jgi:hypothetical protein
LADWFVEEGIAEHRAVQVLNGRIVAAQVHWPERQIAGAVVEAKLVSRAGATRGTAVTASGEEILVDRLPREASEGATMGLRITRAALDGPGRLKRAQARPEASEPTAPSLADTLRAAGASVTIVRRFPLEGWAEIVADALHGEIAFPGGALLLTPTPAMTTVDIDGDLPPRQLALAAVPALADALRRLDIGGSVAIDFPTLSDKADRRAVDAALAEALGDWPHERTAMNGFGLVQIVSRLERLSLVQLASWRLGGFVWRSLLRRAETLEGAGTVELSISPRLEAEIAPAHLNELERRSGKRVRVRKVATLAYEAPNAQLVSDDRSRP